MQENRFDETMTYLEEITELVKNVSPTLVDFSLPRDRARIPTQASSNFITNKEQGDWAENLLIRAVNNASVNYIAVKYGKSDSIVAGEPGFDKFFQEFQGELDTIGKRPDLLIFRKEDYDESLGLDISSIDHNLIDSYVRKAVAGIEVRSSAFLIEHYDEAMQSRINDNTHRALDLSRRILSEYSEELSHASRVQYRYLLESICPESLSITDFKVPGWRSTERLSSLNESLKELKSYIKEVQKRDYLSITPKVEDLKVVYKWIETYNVPHFYFQVFFDKVYGISFKRILEIITDPENEGVIFSVESDSKNQNKDTVKVRSKSGIEVAYKVDEPEHYSVRREMERGRLLFYVTFNGGTAYLDIDNLRNILDIKGDF